MLTECFAYLVRTSASALEDIPGAIDVPFFARRIRKWGGFWTFSVVTGDKVAFEAWMRGNLAFHSWSEETDGFLQRPRLHAQA